MSGGLSPATEENKAMTEISIRYKFKRGDMAAMAAMDEKCLEVAKRFGGEPGDGGTYLGAKLFERDMHFDIAPGDIAECKAAFAKIPGVTVLVSW